MRTLIVYQTPWCRASPDRERDRSVLRLVVYVTDCCGSVHVLHHEVHSSLLCGTAAHLQSCACREGEDGDNFWMIESGIYKAVKQAPQDGERLLFRYEGKGAFGELALMYNCPRAATVVVNKLASSCGALWLQGPLQDFSALLLWLKSSAGVTGQT